jgi:hypothetical protein
MNMLHLPFDIIFISMNGSLDAFIHFITMNGSLDAFIHVVNANGSLDTFIRAIINIIVIEYD